MPVDVLCIDVAVAEVSVKVSGVHVDVVCIGGTDADVCVK